MGYGQADQTDREMMALALAQARISLDGGGVPVGAVLAVGGDLIAAGHNERVQRGDPVAHGEISCLRNAGRRPSYLDTTLYTTLSPCQMCTGAILLFQIPRLLSDISKVMTLEPGDIVLTGTPKGVGPVVPGDIMRAGIKVDGKEIEEAKIEVNVEESTSTYEYAET